MTPLEQLGFEFLDLCYDLKINPEDAVRLQKKAKEYHNAGRIAGIEEARGAMKSDRMCVRIGENGLAMKELGVSMEDIKLHNSHADGFEEGWKSARTEWEKNIAALLSHKEQNHG